MRLEFSSSDSVISVAEKEFDQRSSAVENSAEISEMLQAGIKAAQSGNRHEARNLLLRVTEADQKNENAWLWLASISEYPEELLVFLNNVLDINPANERALEWAKATKSLLAKNLIQRGIESEKENRREVARQCFMQAVIHDNRNEMAWLWLASVAETDEEKTAHLRRVLEINPNNETALESLESIKTDKPETLLPKICKAAVNGDKEFAETTLEKLLSDFPELETAWLLKAHLTDSLREKIECFEKVSEMNAENLAARVNVRFFREMLGENESVEEIPCQAVENQEVSFLPPTEDFSREAAQPLNFSNEDQPEEVFEENQAQLEIFPANDESLSYEEPAAEDNFWENIAAGAENEAVSEMRDDNAAETWAETETENESEGEYVFESNLAYEDAGNDDESYQLNLDETVVTDYSNENLYAEQFAEPQEAENIPAEQFTQPESDSFNEEPVEEESAESYHTLTETYAEQTAADYAEQEEETVYHPAANSVICAFCRADNDPQTFVCRWCDSMLTLSDLETLLAHNSADTEIVRQAIEEMETEAERRELKSEELVNLGIGYINLKDLRKGLSVLQKAAKLDLNNVVLESQVNSLAIRLSEIEEKENNHHAMPRDRTIMVIDDSATVRKLIAGKLEKCGHIVITAVDGMDAMEKLGDVTPDLILLDIAMPRMDGYQVCKLIRNNEATKDIPIVMISGKDGFFDKVRGRMSGTTNYITKPFGPETLMKMLETYLV